MTWVFAIFCLILAMGIYAQAARIKELEAELENALDEH